MTRKPPSTPQEFIEFLLRRKKWIILSMLIVPPLVFLVGNLWPKKYQSETMILVDPQKVSAEYVKATVPGDVTDRLQTISDEVLSRTGLLTIANEDHLYQTEREKYGDDSAVAAIHKDITVDIIRGATDRSPIDGFKISYIASNPQLAQKVTQQIADLFIEANVKQRDQDAEGTELFIENQLLKARAQLAQQDQKIRAFKAAHLGELPEQETANLAMIGEYQNMAQENNEAIDRANQQRVYLESMLNVNGNHKLPAPVAAPTPLQLQLQKDEDQLTADLQLYTDQYPDVIRLRDQIATLKAEIKRQPANTAHAITTATGGPNLGEQLESQLKATNEEIQSRTARQQQLENKVSAIQGQVQSLPAVQQEYESLSRDYTEMQQNYQSLLQKQQASAMAAQLELHNDSEHFRVIDPANLPIVPVSPNLSIVYAGGLLGGLIVGLCVAFFEEMRDPTIHNADEAEMYLSVPLIAALPAMHLDQALPAGGSTT